MLGFHALGQQALGGLVSSTLVDYSLTCAAGNFTISGQAAGLKATRKVTAAAGSYAITGQNARLIQTYPELTADAGSYTISGQAANLEWGHRLVGAAGAYTISGQTARLLFAHRVAASAGSYTITGQNAGLRATRKLPMGAGSYAISGQAATFKVNMPAEVGAYLIAGQSATFGVNMPADVGSYTINGQDARTLKQFVLHASHLPVVAIYRRQFGFAALGEVALGEHDYIDTPATTYQILGQSVEFRVPRLQAEVGSYLIDGQAANLEQHRILYAGAGAYVVTGYPTYYGRTSAPARQLISNPGTITFATPQGLSGAFITDATDYGDQLFRPGVL